MGKNPSVVQQSSEENFLMKNYLPCLLYLPTQKNNRIRNMCA